MLGHQCPHPYHKSKPRLLIELVLPFSLLAALALSFFIGRVSVRDVAELETEKVVLENQVIQLEKDIKSLAKQKDFAESSKTIDQLALKDTKYEMMSLHNKVAELNESLAFYRRVVAPETLIKGVYIQHFEMLKKTSDNNYQYQLIIAQGYGASRAIKGRVELVVKGQKKGKALQLSFNQLGSDPKKDMAFAFRYYQFYSGLVNLPVDFLPESVVITIRPDSKNIKVVEKVWPWSKLIKNS